MFHFILHFGLEVGIYERKQESKKKSTHEITLLTKKIKRFKKKTVRKKRKIKEKKKENTVSIK